MWKGIESFDLAVGKPLGIVTRSKGEAQGEISQGSYRRTWGRPSCPTTSVSFIPSKLCFAYDLINL